MKVSIRPACQTDARTVAALLGHLGYPASEEQSSARIELHSRSSTTVLLLAEIGGDVAGLVSFHCIPTMHADTGLGRITALVVAPAHRKKGVGKALVRAAEELGRLAGCERMEITSSDHRPATHAIYEHLGYRVDCRRFLKSLEGFPNPA